MASPITSPSALRTLAIQNPGIFAALFARAPSSVTFKGKTYARAAATTVDQRLWYLAAAATTQPSSVASIARGSYSLDEVYGLDPDRSALDAAERAERDAKAKVAKVRAALDGVNRRIRDAEQRLSEALAAQKEAQKVQVGDVFTLGISAAGRNLYADGQVQLWKDRIQSLKSGVLVGMAGQEGFAIPTNGGQAQLEGALKDAQAELAAASAEVKAQRRAYDDAARAARQEEERARAEQARDDAERARAEREARARDEAARRAQEEQDRAASSSSTGSGGVEWTNQPTDPGYESGAPDDYTFSDEWMDELDTARDLFGDEDDARAYAEDVLGVDDADALLAYVSPYSFDSYYGADCACDGCSRGGDCDVVDDMRLAMLDAGWGYDADDAEQVFGADKITEEGDQGYSGIAPPAPTGAFDFASIIPVIIGAVLALAPALLSSLGAPASLNETAPGMVPPPPRPAARRSTMTGDDTTDGALVAGGALLLVKLLG